MAVTIGEQARAFLGQAAPGIALSACCDAIGLIRHLRRRKAFRAIADAAYCRLFFIVPFFTV